jgi:hypothetical protein
LLLLLGQYKRIEALLLLPLQLGFHSGSFVGIRNARLVLTNKMPVK